MIYEVYTTHVHYQKTQIKKVNVLVFFNKSILVTAVSQTVI